MTSPRLQGIRGAVQSDANTPEAILSATRRLLEELVRANKFEAGDVAAAIFTVTDDLTATFPAEAARAMGWTQVPMLCAREIPVPGSLPRTVRALLLVNLRAAAKHVYLGETQCLRPDLSGPPAEEERGRRRSGATQKLRARLLGRSLSQGPANTDSPGDEKP
jgi:monofunctional chorismate mutase